MTQFDTFPSKAGLKNCGDDANAARKRIERLEQLARWHRLNANHAGSTWIWDLRLRAAEDLERQAAQLRDCYCLTTVASPKKYAITGN